MSLSLEQQEGFPIDTFTGPLVKLQHTPDGAFSPHALLHRIKNGDVPDASFPLHRVADYAGFSIDVTFSIEPHRIQQFLELIGGDIHDPTHRAYAMYMSRCFPLTALYWGIGTEHNTPLYVSHTSIGAPIHCRAIDTHLQVTKVGKTSLVFGHLQTQQHEGAPVYVGGGTDVIVFDPYPYASEAIPKPQQRQPAEPDKGYVVCGDPYVATQDQVDAMAEITGDHNPAHTNPEYMRNSRFQCGTIAHGWLGLTGGLLSCTEYIRRHLGTGGNLRSLQVTFQSPAIVGETSSVPMIKPGFAPNTYSFMLWEKNRNLPITSGSFTYK